jgi:hypothetical protein
VVDGLRRSERESAAGIKENWSWRRRSQGDLEREYGAREHSKSG